MDIVYLAHFAGSPHHGMVYGHYYMARELVRAGHAVTIVAASHAHPRFAQPRISGLITEEFIDGIRYLWVRTPAYSPESWPGRVRSMLTFVAKTWWGRLPVPRGDVVIASSHFPFAIHPARRLARRWGSTLVFEVRDIWPLTLIEVGGASARHPFIRLMQWSEDYAYRHADVVVSVLAGALAHMKTRGLAPAKFLLVPNGIDVDASHPQEPIPPSHAKALTRLRGADGFLVGYAGKVGASNALHTLVEGVAACRSKHVRAVILGEGSHVAALKARAYELGVADRILLLDPVRKSQVGGFLERMDAAYLGLQRHSVFRFGVSPTKLNDYMLAARPILYAVDAPDDVVAESEAGLSCRAEDPADVARALEALAAMSPEARAEMGARGRKWILRNRDYRVLADRFLSGVKAIREAGA